MRRLWRKSTRTKPNIRYFTWSEYLFTIAILGFVFVLPVFMFGGVEAFRTGGTRYLFWGLLFLAGVAALFCAVTSWQKYQAFDRPMRALAEAASRVAKGDFTVRIESIRPSARQRYVGVMFHDFNTMVAELASLETMKNDFISHVSHEFKTPLATIQNYATDLRYMDLPPQTQREYLDTIMNAAANLDSLVSNILRLNKIEHQTMPLRKDSFDLCQQLCECAIAFGDRWEAKGIDFSAEIEDRRIICEDAELLSLVWNNLLSNAIKFTDSGGAVILRERCDEDTVIVSVCDTGCGMDSGTARHVFDKFYQGDESRSREGNGLGLTLAQRVVNLCDGTISVESTPGEGSVFTVKLPLSR